MRELRLPVVIVGLGISGQAALRLLLAVGLRRQDILTYDPQQKVSCDLPDLESLKKANPGTLVVSPGVPLNSPWLQELLKQDVLLTSELEIASRFLTSERVVGITGAVGKSTVTSLIGAGLKTAKLPAFIGGNLGQPLADYACQLLDSSPPVAWVILELSSYQLENFRSLKPEASILVSLTPNHLERYRNLNEYYETKLTLVPRTTSHVIFNLNGLDLRQYRSRFSDSRHHWTSGEEAAHQNFPFEQMHLVGNHNRDNIALASALGKLLGWPETYQKGLLEFRGLPHRLENIGIHREVLFLNDSKATTIASVQQAIESIGDLVQKYQSTWLLLGGKDKNLPWKDLSYLAEKSKFRFIFFGEVGEKARTESGLTGDFFPHLNEALNHVFMNLKPSDLVLLSPGGTSWDEFRSFEERGDFFRTQIEKWSADQNQPAKPD